MENPYDIIKSRYITEKTAMLEQLHTSKSNRSLAKCESPKYVFLVESQANKHEIAQAIERIYKDKDIKVTKVNTIYTKGKLKKRGRGRLGSKPAFKKAIVTLEPGDTLDNV